jgi:archaellum component FlaC
MKKNIFIAFAFAALLLAGCKGQPDSQRQADNSAQRDSLENIIAQKDNDINSMMGLMNEIQEGFREINEAENRVNIVKDGEGANKSQQIRENIQFIASRMKQNRELIAKLQKQLQGSSLKGTQMKSTIDNLIKQLDEKDQQLQQLRAELDAKDIHISELDETINNLNTNVSDLSNDNAQKTQTINTQDKQINTAWYAFGNKRELKEQGIYSAGGKILQGNFNKNYFTKVDIRDLHEIKFYSKSARLLTVHPSSSYTLYRDANKQYTLRITNPQVFWSTSKYLVVLVR